MSLRDIKIDVEIQDKKITEDIKLEILNSAFENSMQTAISYGIIPIDETEIKEKLYRMYNQDAFTKIPLIVFFVAQTSDWAVNLGREKLGFYPRKKQIKDTDILYAVDQSAKTLMKTAKDLGISSYYIPDIINESDSLKDLLELESGEVAASIMFLGYINN